MSKASSRLGMRVLVDSIQSETPRPKSPKMNNEEPIILSHFPGAKPPPEGQTSRIERDDFPAPPYPYTDPGKSKTLREILIAMNLLCRLRFVLFGRGFFNHS